MSGKSADSLAAVVEPPLQAIVFTNARPALTAGGYYLMVSKLLSRRTP